MDTFVAHLSKVFKPFEVVPGYAESEIKYFLNVPYQKPSPIKLISPAEVKAEINKLNVQKAPGYDLIMGQILKNLPQKAIVLLTIIYNRMLRLS